MRRPAAGLVVALASAVACNDPAGPQEFTCEPPDIAVDTWIEATGPGVRFLLPPRFTGGGSSYAAGRDWLRFDVVSPGQRPTDPEFQLFGYRSCATTIGGQSVLLENGATRAEAQVDEGFYIAATWRSVKLAPMGDLVHLVMSGFTHDREDVVALFRAIHTVEFLHMPSSGAAAPIVSVSRPPERF